jgi:CubicO group peptidase (beta-lactamase class C family)
MAISFGSRAFMVALLAAMLCWNPLTAFAQTSADADAAIVRDLDAFIERVMATDLSPGVGVAVVRGADVIYAKGFGFADRERRRRATADTQFYIASTTKSFTALAGALLASRGLIDLDMPLSRALPGAKFHPEVSPDRITLRDLLTHTHGIRGGPIEIRTAFTGEFTNAQLLDILKFHAPAPTGRSFAYSNLGYNIFGMVLDEKFKEGWKQVLQREVFDPLDLRSTTAWISKVDPNRLAQPYELRAGGGPERVDYAKRDENMQAAGGHVSTANDLARYLIAHLNGGRINGRQALPEAAVGLTHRQQVEQNRNYGSFHRFGWGLGWDLATYDGDTILQRFGGFQGFHSHVSFMPERGIGVVVLANGGGASSFVADLIATYAYDRVLAKPTLLARSEERWKAFVDEVARGRAAIAKDLATRQARPQTTPLPLGAYVGTYESPALGRMVWTLENGRLQVRMGVAAGDVEVFNGAQHEFRVTLTGGGSVVAFDVTPGARQPSGLRWADQVFTRVQ